VRLNGTLISLRTDAYHYKAYLETLLNYNKDDGETMLKPQGCYNALDFPAQLTVNNTNTEGDRHEAFQALPFNQQKTTRQGTHFNATTVLRRKLPDNEKSPKLSSAGFVGLFELVLNSANH